MSDLRLLEQFVSVYRNRSFRTAADEMGIAQSSVTKRIQQLEALAERQVADLEQPAVGDQQ